jgi:hypothetical protein
MGESANDRIKLLLILKNKLETQSEYFKGWKGRIGHGQMT